MYAEGFATIVVNLDEELLFNDDPSTKYSVDEQVMALDESSGGRKRAVVLKEMGMGVYLLRFFHDKSEQACYATLMGKAKETDTTELEVLAADVTRTETDQGITVTTVMTIRNPKTNTEFTQSTTETRAVKPQAKSAPVASPAESDISAKTVLDAKKQIEFDRVLAELFASEIDFATRLEAVHTFYEKEIDQQNLLPPMARAVVFGNNSLVKLLTKSRSMLEWSDKEPAKQFAAFQRYLEDARPLYNDQITSRSLGHVPLQAYLQSNAKFRKFACAQVPKVEKFFKEHGMTTHGHLGSVLYAPVQRLPRVMLLAQRLLSLNPSIVELANLLTYVKQTLSEFESEQ